MRANPFINSTFTPHHTHALHPQQFETELPEAVNGGWTITLVTDKPITMTLNLEADLLSQSPDQRTSVFGPKSWNGVTVNPNLAKGRLVRIVCMHGHECTVMYGGVHAGVLYFRP